MAKVFRDEHTWSPISIILTSPKEYSILLEVLRRAAAGQAQEDPGVVFADKLFVQLLHLTDEDDEE